MGRFDALEPKLYYDATAGDLRVSWRELVPVTHFVYLPTIGNGVPRKHGEKAQ